MKKLDETTLFKSIRAQDFSGLRNYLNAKGDVSIRDANGHSLLLVLLAIALCARDNETKTC